MAEYRGNQFIGIVEHLKDSPTDNYPTYDYCELNQESGGLCGYPDVEFMGEVIAHQFGESFRQKITYEPPQGTDKRRTEQGICPRRYHQMSVLERDKFEKAVLKELKGEQ